MLSWVFGTKIADIQASDDVNRDTGVGVHIRAVGEGPTVAVDTSTSGSSAGGTVGSPVSPTTPEPGPGPSVPAGETAYVTATPTFNPGTVVGEQPIKVNGNTKTQFIFSTQYPKFSGHTNIRNALVHLVIASKYVVTGNVHANSNGDWSWVPSSPIYPESHTLTITATDEQEPQITSKVVLYFTINLPAGQKIELPQAYNAADKGNGGNLFDVIVGVPLQFKTITAGQELVAKIKFVNYGSPGHSVDVEAQYSIRDSNGDVVMQSSQTIAVATQLSIIKTFYPSESLAPGIYTITVAVPSEDLVATATDTFEIKAKTDGAGTTDSKTPPINYSITFQIIAGMLLLFSLILYLEYNKVEMLSATIRQLSEKDLV
jgi:hypothetical protein